MKQKLITTIFLLTGYCLTAYSQVGITPRLLELDNTQVNKSQAFRLYNFSEKDVQVQVEINNWTMTDDNQIQLIPSETHSLDQWTIVNPLIFTVKAESSQTIRLAFRPPLDIQAGEYKTMLYFNQILIDDAPQSKQLRSRFRIGAAVYLQIGDQQIAAKALSASVDQNKQLHVTVNNTGNTHARFNGDWYIWTIDPTPHIQKLTAWRKEPNKTRVDIPGLIASDILPNTPILAGHQRNIKIDSKDFDFKSGQALQLLLLGQLGKQDISQVLAIEDKSTPQHDR